MPEWFLLDTRMQGIALSVISLAHNLNMRVIAEGVETREQVAFLSAHGCDEMQRYFFSCPVAQLPDAGGRLWRAVAPASEHRAAAILVRPGCLRRTRPFKHAICFGPFRFVLHAASTA